MLQIHSRALLVILFLLPISAIAQAPAPNQTEWENEALALRLFYPSDLIKADAAQVTQNGHLSLFGVSSPSDSALANATNCLHPMLLLQLPQSGPAQATTSEPTPDGGTKVTTTPSVTASIVLAELDVECVNEQKQLATNNLLPQIAGIVDKVPGMRSIAPPSDYTIGWQKVYMSAAQGQPQNQPQPDSAHPQPTGLLQLFTMGISTNWNSHLLVWYFSSNNIETLNRITKTTVRFGRAQAAPLYPIAILPIANAPR